jgi:hypothetical protein
MIADSVHIALQTSEFSLPACMKGTWLALLHARRVPPHVGLMIDGNYNSLTVKGHELDIPFEAVYKTAIRKNIESAFIRVVPHPVFSADYQISVLQEMICGYSSVKQNEATCLSPIREFFSEFYAVTLKHDELLFDFMDRLNRSHFLQLASACNFSLGDNFLEMPFYTRELLHEKIKNERLPFYND